MESSINRNSPLEILYEDSSLLALNKPPCCHSAALPAGKGGESIASVLLAAWPSLAAASEKPEDCGLIHRLDFETSGVLLAARTREAWKALRASSKAGRIAKRYTFLAEGLWKQEGKVEAFISSRYARSKKVQVSSSQPRSSARALPARTNFKATHQWPLLNISLVEAGLFEGRRHQVRALAAFLGSPLVGDALYGASTSLRPLMIPLKDGDNYLVPDFLLHAQGIDFPHPLSGRSLRISAPLPEWCRALVPEVRSVLAAAISPR